MPNVKISALPQVTGLTNSDIIPAVAGTGTSKITLKDLANTMPSVTSSLSASLSTSSSLATSASLATSSSVAISSSLATSASLATSSSVASSSSFAISASVASSSSFAISSTSASFSVTSSLTLNLPYREFIGQFTQTSTNDPVVNVISNTFGQTLAWVRNSAGNYSVIVSGSHPNMAVIGTTESMTINDRTTYSYVQLSGGNYKVNTLVRKISDSTFADLNMSDGFTIMFRSY